MNNPHVSHWSLFCWTLVAAALPLAAATTPARAGESGENAAPAQALLDRFADGDAAAGAALKARFPTPAAMEKALAAPRAYAASRNPAHAGKPWDEVLTIADAMAGTKTDLFVRLPKNYDAAKPWPVIISLHWLTGKGDMALKELDKFWTVDDFIVAAPSVQKGWWTDWPTCFALTGLSAVKRRYHVDTSRCFLMGISMGGFGAWNVGLRYPDRWAGVAPVMGGVSRIEYVGIQDRSRRRLLVNARNTPFYFLHGDRDPIVPVAFDRRTATQFQQWGYEHVYREVPGLAHEIPRDASLMRDMLEGVATWLRGRARNNDPREVRHFAFEPGSADNFWLRVEHETGGGAAVAKYTGANEIAVDVSRVRRVTVFFNRRLIDYAKPARITLNGHECFNAPVVPSVDALLDSWKRREDPALLYDAGVTFDTAPPTNDKKTPDGPRAGAPSPAGPPGAGGDF
ncbi:MAG: hypothetical protein HY719_11240 [Planctomycetes bacterium]|nr:hypothetical protein [Planctomycetota bacterium]